jgi:hypothetical protein
MMSGLGLVAFGNATITKATDVCIMICLNIWDDYYVLVYINHSELMKAVGSHCSLFLLFIMKVIV